MAHNAGFDVDLLNKTAGIRIFNRIFTSVDTVAMARILLPTLSKYKLNVVANALHISLENHHRAVDDAEATAEIFVRFVEMLDERNIRTLTKLNQFGAKSKDAVKKTALLPCDHSCQESDRACEFI